MRHAVLAIDIIVLREALIHMELCTTVQDQE
jgi:hypothetical protein